MSRLVWVPKKSTKCSMCDSNHSHKYKIVEFGIWWENNTAYVNYNFCSICFTILKELFPDDVKTVKDFSKERKFIESRYPDHRDYLYNIIKNGPKYNKFIERRTEYVNNLYK